ncbi:MAG: patatin-like phospholipase family protein [Bacteroidaceae bacterium]|nr:patatin-like phospholipase family protein [Bacteroidaceae bacterium]
MKRLILLLFVLLQTIGAISQESQDSVPKRKKVAVVLSGGGAKGMAHIGALKVIERAGIPIDIVTGTSMGSIVGGLYAIGYNAQLLDSLVRQQDWAYVISDREDMSRQSLRDREKQNTYALSYGLTIGKRNENDGGIIKGKNLSQLFHKLCIGYLDSLDFNKLPIPFACVATNIIDNTEYDFHAGRLPQAMRASMAIPAAFSPVRLGDKVLVDGGLRNNYPADIAREMGADIIIGVTVQGAPKTADELGHTLSILSQVIDVNCMNKYDENIAITDVPIRVNTTGYNAASFTANAIDTLIRRGEDEAMKHWDELLALRERIGIDSTFQPTLLTPFSPTILTEKVKLSGVHFINTTPHDEHFIREKFHLDRCDSIDAKQESRIATSMRVDLFYQNADVHTELDSVGYKLIIAAGNKKTSQVHIGFRFDTEEMVALQLNADFPLNTSLPIDADFTLRLGKRTMARTDFTLHPRSFTRPMLSYVFRHNDINIYAEGDRDHNFVYNHHQASLVPINFNVSNFNVKASLRWDYFHFQGRVLSSDARPLTLTADHYFSYRVQANYNSENNWYFPSVGARFKAEYAYLTDNIAQLQDKPGLSDVSAHWRISFPLSQRLTLQPMLYGRLLFGANVPYVFGNKMGGDTFGHYMEQQMPFAGLGHIEHADNHFLGLQMQLQQRIADNNYAILRLSAAQHGDQLKRTFEHKTLLGGQVAYYYNTLFGPLGATLGYSNLTKNFYFCIHLGFEF